MKNVPIHLPLVYLTIKRCSRLIRESDDSIGLQTGHLMGQLGRELSILNVILDVKVLPSHFYGFLRIRREASIQTRNYRLLRILQLFDINLKNYKYMRGKKKKIDIFKIYIVYFGPCFSDNNIKSIGNYTFIILGKI